MVKFESHLVEIHAVFFRANHTAAHFGAVLGILQKEGLANVKMLPQAQQATVSVHNLSFRLLLDLLALFVFGENKDAHPQNYAFASASIFRGGHRFAAPFLYFTPIRSHMDWPSRQGLLPV
jgi:hypothetical protein